VERVSRLIVLVSILVAAVTHAVLAHTQTSVVVATAAAFVATWAVARASLPLALGIVAGTAYVAPGLLTAAFGIYDYHQLGVWMAALAGLVMAHADVRRWHLPARWRFPLIGWALVLALSWPVVAAREVDFSLVAARTHGVANGLAQLSPPSASAFVTLVALTQLLGLVWIDLLFARFRNDLQACARFVGVPFVAGAAVGSVVGIYQRVVDPEFLNLPIWANLPRAGGLMNDANTFGTGAAIWAALSVAVAWLAFRRPLAGALTYLLLAAGMWSAGSRTALLTFVAGSIGIGIALLKRRGVWQPRMGRIAALLGAGVVILIVAVLPRTFDGGNPLMRALDRVPRLDGEEIRRFVVDDLWVRFGYGQAAVDMIADHPLAGIGVGAFHIVAPEYIYRADGRTLASDNAQNWWRHQLAELGVLGALPAIWASILIVGLLFGEAERDPPGVVTILRAAIAGVGISSLFGVPTQHPATWLSFATAVFLLYALVHADGESRAERPAAGAVIAGLALAAMVSAGLMVTARGNLRPLTRALDSVAPHVQGLSPLEGFSDYGEFRWTGTSAIAAVPVRDRWLQLTLWAPFADVASRAITARVSIDGNQVIAHRFDTAEAGSYFISMPDRRAVTMAYSISGAVPSQRAVQIAITWRSQPPAGTPAERIIR
jgi:O-antigen ligase